MRMRILFFFLSTLFISIPSSSKTYQGFHDVHVDMKEILDIDGGEIENFDPNPTIIKNKFCAGRHDRSLEYLIYDHVVIGSSFIQLSQSLGVTLCTQSSVENLHLLVEISQLWEGPLSIAVFVSPHEFGVVKIYISYLRSCFKHVRDRVSFSLVHPMNFPTFSFNPDFPYSKFKT